MHGAKANKITKPDMATQMQKYLSLEQLNAMKAASLRDVLKTERVDTSGVKSELVSRLCALQPTPQPPLFSAGSKRRRREGSKRVFPNATAILVTSNVSRTDGKKEQTTNCIADIKTELSALDADMARAIEKAETVSDFLFFFHVVVFFVCIRTVIVSAVVQSNDPDGYGVEMACICIARGNHKRMVSELTAVEDWKWARKAGVTVTTVEEWKWARLPVVDLCV